MAHVALHALVHDEKASCCAAVSMNSFFTGEGILVVLQGPSKRDLYACDLLISATGIVLKKVLL